MGGTTPSPNGREEITSHLVYLYSRRAYLTTQIKMWEEELEALPEKPPKKFVPRDKQRVRVADIRPFIQQWKLAGNSIKELSALSGVDDRLLNKIMNEKTGIDHVFYNTADKIMMTIGLPHIMANIEVVEGKPPGVPNDPT